MSGRKQLTLHSFLKKSERNSASSTKNGREDTVTSIQIGWLLDAVKHVKSQKQRPDRERICHYIQQHHDVTSETVSLLLDSAVKNNILTTTITRGNTDKLTYVITGTAPVGGSLSVTSPKQGLTNASNDSDNKKILHNKSDISPFMVKAVKALKESSGSSLNDIAEYILTSCNVELKNGVDLIRLVKLSARQAVRNNMLVKNKDNLYKVARGPGRPAKQGDSPAKPKAKAKPIPICCFCLGDEKKNRDKQPEDLVSCCRCGQSGHPSCLKFSESQTKFVLGMDDWECYDCKKCAVCKVSKRTDNNMLICDQCDRSLHPHCCQPPVKKPPDGTWICHICTNGPQGKQPKSKTKEEGAAPSSANGRVKFGQIRKKYEYKKMCATPGCDGSGNTNPIMTNHRKQTGCPLLSKEERTRLRQGKQLETDSDDDLASKQSSQDSSTLSSSADQPLPKGLTDGLSQFFTPSDKRTSRVSMSSMFTAATANQPVKQPKSAATTSQAAANRILKKSKLVQRSKAQALQSANNNTAKPDHNAGSSNASSLLSLNDLGLPGVSQLKGLVDGMTRFFTPTGDRKRSVPIYAAPTRKRKDTDKSGATRSAAEESDGAGIFSDEGKSDGTIIDSLDKDNLPPGVAVKDYRLFRKSQKEAKEPGSMGLLVKPVVEHGKRYPPLIEFGKYELQTWYSSPYPQEYAQLPKLYICEFCLKYMKSRSILQRHMDKCGLTNPPATEIYRKDSLSVFEVDGNANKIYCQNLCLLAKLFLDHKTLYYDVEPFLFYVLTFNDEDGCHFVGYFSKEKHCQQKYNVSCITTLPQHQRKGYGKFLIDFSYLLSRIEGTPGSPEKPLSELGKISYKSYWKCTLLEYLHHHKDDSSLTIKSISSDTGMCAHDIASTLQELKMIDMNTADDIIISLDRAAISKHMAKISSSPIKPLVIDEECLRWAPVVSSHSPSSPEKSSSPDKAGAVSRMREKRLTIDADMEVEPEPVKSPPPRRNRGSTAGGRQQTRTTEKTPQSSLSPLRSRAPRENKTTSGGETVKNGPTSPRNKQSPVRSPSAGRASRRSPFSPRSRSGSKAPSVPNGVLPTASTRRRQSQQDVYSSDEEENIVKQKPPPPKKRRGSCKEDKVSRRKSGSPSTPEKKGRWSGTRSSSARRSRSSRQNNCNSKDYSKSAAADERRGANGKACDGFDDTYLSDASSRSSHFQACYDASASDVDSDNSEVEHSSNESAPWSPTIRRTSSESPSVMNRDGQSSSALDGLSNAVGRITPITADLDFTKAYDQVLCNDLIDSYDKNPDERENTDRQAKIDGNYTYSGIETKDRLKQSQKIDQITAMDQLLVPQSYPPNTAPEIDPATLCFESPISLSSNDTSLNGTQLNEQQIQQPDQQSAMQPCNNAYSTDFHNVATGGCDNNALNSNIRQKCNIDMQQQTQQTDFMDNNMPTIPSGQQQAPQSQEDYHTQQPTHGQQLQPLQQQQQCSYNNNMMSDQQHPSPQGIQQHTSPQSYQQHTSPQSYQQHMSPQNYQQHTSPQNVQQHPSPMFPPQSPQVMIPQSPHQTHLAPQSPLVPQKSPLLHPMSPHIPPQSPHYQQNPPMLSPGHQQTPYNSYSRGRANSMSKVTPPGLTPPPGTPSPSKHQSPDRYQQYLKQGPQSLKSPNVTINGRDMQYGGTVQPPAPMYHNMQNLSPHNYQHHPQPMNNQHFFPNNHYMDPRYLNSYQMQQLSQAAQPAALYGQLPPNPTGMYGYHYT